MFSHIHTNHISKAMSWTQNNITMFKNCDSVSFQTKWQHFLIYKMITDSASTITMFLNILQIETRALCFYHCKSFSNSKTLNPHYPKSPIPSYLHVNNKLNIDYPVLFSCLQISYTTQKTLEIIKSITMNSRNPLTEFIFDRRKRCV